MVESIIVGRAGNQKEKILDPKVGTFHCRISVDADMPGKLMVEILSVKPTYINGERLYRVENMVDEDAVVTIGDTYHCRVKDLLKETFDFKELTDWGKAAQRYERLIDVEAVLSLMDFDFTEPTDYVIEGSLTLCKAYRLIEEGRLREAQKIIYEEGDKLYSMLDNSPLIRNVYASAMALATLLYKKAGMEALAQQCEKNFLKMLSQGMECSQTVKNSLN